MRGGLDSERGRQPLPPDAGVPTALPHEPQGAVGVVADDVAAQPVAQPVAAPPAPAPAGRIGQTGPHAAVDDAVDAATEEDAGAGRVADEGRPDGPGPVVPGPMTPFRTVLATVHRAQLSRTRVARMPLLFVATFQSVGIMLLLRGIIDVHSITTRQAAVAGATVLVVAFVALNLLAQYVGALKAARALDYYAVLPVSPAAVVLGITAAYAAFAVPGTVVTALVGTALFHLPFGGLWILSVVVPLSGAALAGLGALIGLLAPRQELATLAGQLGMSAVLFLGIIPADRMPSPLVWVRDVLPSSYAVDALADSFAVRVDWPAVVGDLGVCAAVGVLALALSARVFRRTVGR